MSIFDKLAAQENDFSKSLFFSPVLKNTPIRVRIAGVLVTLKVAEPKDFFGWGVFQPLNYKRARFIRDPNMHEKQEYYKLFPVLRLVLCRHNEENWFGTPAHQSDTRFKITGTVPVRLAQEVQMFDTVQARFDGTNIWFEQIDPRHNVRNAAYLRESLTNSLEKDKLELAGLSIEERDAYFIAYNDAVEAKRDRQEEKIKTALHRAGAKYQSYIERANTYTIEFTVNGEKHRSVVNKNNLAIESAGICLAGTDRNFDLQSLVGVIVEGQRRRLIVPVGLNREYGDRAYYNREDDDYD